MQNKQREPGYYWVKWQGAWQPVKFSGGWWVIFGGMANHKFEAINETRILSPDEQPVAAMSANALPFIDEDAPRDNFERAAQARGKKTYSCDCAPTRKGFQFIDTSTTIKRREFPDTSNDLAPSPDGPADSKREHWFGLGNPNEPVPATRLQSFINRMMGGRKP